VQVSIKTFTVTFPTEAGFIGRECNSSGCGRYFKVHEDSLRDHMHCPYCAQKFEKDQLYTKDQLEHAENQAAELAKEYMYGEIDKMFGNFASRNRSGLIKFTHTPIRYKAKPVVARYKEREVDSELTCPECGVIFQVFGIFGFCPGCRSENQAIYDANLAIVRQEIASAPDGDRALRHAYSDLVSAFESFCIRRAPAECRGTNFQDLFEARRAFRSSRNVDILQDLSQDELLVLRRTFQKRHAHVHNGGIIGERYTKKMPEDASLLGQRAQLSIDEFEAAAKSLRPVVDRIARLR
jgi:hypothetical protein